MEEVDLAGREVACAVSVMGDGGDESGDGVDGGGSCSREWAWVFAALSLATCRWCLARA